MNVRLKKEIISLGLDHIKPAERTGEEITPTEFKQWLDEGREVAIIDTRNDYEIRLGTFDNALDLNLKSFRAFPKAIQSLPESMKDTPVVMFCTGGIRCEKASVVMMDAGFSNVKQLKGGILGYFEEVGGEITGMEIALSSTIALPSVQNLNRPRLCNVLRAVSP